MSKVSSVVCDGCGKHKGEGNHWTLVAHYVQPNPIAVGVLAIALAENEARLPDSRFAPAIYDVCGSACEQRIIGKLRSRESE